MFVIVQCWSNMKKDPSSQGLDITEQMGMAIKHAGVSITVTSLTDVFAFGVGAVTVSRFDHHNHNIVVYLSLFRKCQAWSPFACAQQSDWDQFICCKFPGSWLG